MGRALASWSQLEHALAKAFAVTCGLPIESAKATFFSERRFFRKIELLVAAVDTGSAAASEAITLRNCVFKAGCNKAKEYAPLRNKVAHEQTAVLALGSIVLGGVVSPNILANDIEGIKGEMLTVQAIKEAAQSFSLLADLIAEACDELEVEKLSTLWERVRSLPAKPYSDQLDAHILKARTQQSEFPEEKM
jgi:hypothetical protein